MNNHIKSHIDKAMESIKVTDTLQQSLSQKLETEQVMPTEEVLRHKMPVRRKKWAILAAAAVLAAAFPLTAGAHAAYRAVSAWVTNAVNAQVAQDIYPINVSATDQGIKVEVESAVNDNHNALIFITVQDTEGKGRLGEDIDLCDSCDLDISGRNGHAVASADLESYDPATQTARFCFSTMIHGDISGKPAAVKLNGIMAHKIHYPTLDTDVDLAALAQQHPQVGGSAIKEIYGIGYTNVEEPAAPKKSDILTPDVMDIPLGNGLDFVHITNIGYVDGRLHIQTRWEPSFDNHGELRLCRRELIGKDGSCELTDCLAPDNGITDIHFATAEDKKNNSFYSHTKHIEYLFDVPPEDLNNYRLMAADFVQDGELTRGEWQLKFTTRHTDTLQLDGGSLADSVEITPLGVYVEQYTGKKTPQVVITFRDGSTETVDCFEMTIQSGIFRRKSSCYAGYLLEKPLGDISSVALDGNELLFAAD